MHECVYFILFKLRVLIFYLVVPFTEKFEPLGSLVHKNSIQVTRLHRTDLYGFLTPAHNLIGMDISWKTQTGRRKDEDVLHSTDVVFKV